MTKLSITYQLTSALNPRSNNPRTHSPKQIAQLVRSMQHFGFTNPVLVDDTNGIIAGHGRVYELTSQTNQWESRFAENSSSRHCAALSTQNQMMKPSQSKSLPTSN